MALPATPSSPSLTFYERKRRLAYYFGWLSMGLMFAVLGLGFLLEFYRLPRVAVAPETVALVHRTVTLGEEEPGSRLLVMDSALRLKTPPFRLYDPATALLVEGDQFTVFFGSRATVLRDGKTLGSLDLGQAWDVVAAAVDLDRSVSWILGWSEGRIVARRRDAADWSPEIPVGTAATLDRLSVSLDGGRLCAAWREKNATRVRTALLDGTGVSPGAEFEIGDVEHWDAVRTNGRILLATYHREDRTFQYVTLRLECCPGCASPLAPRKLAFSDPFLLLGRKVTGLAMAVARDRLRVFVTRPTTVQGASVPLDTLVPDAAGSKLTAIGAESVWHLALAAVAPVLMLFFSCSMIFLGFTLLQERGRTAGPRPVEPPRADALQRIMACVLDHILLIPVFLVLIEVLNVSPDTSAPDLEDPRFLQTAAVWLALHFLYHFGMEWRLGWTFGKRILGLRVVELDGSRLTFRGALVRNLVRWVDGEYLTLGVAIGFGAMMMTRQRQRLGDLLARTVVVQERGPDA